MMASMEPPMKLLTRSLAAKPKVKPPMPPNPSKDLGGRPNTSALLIAVHSAPVTTASLVSTSLVLESLTPSMFVRISGR